MSVTKHRRGITLILGAGDVTALRGMTRGATSGPDWLADVAEIVPRSSSAASLTRGGSRGGPHGSHTRRGSLDADVHRLLTHEEEEEYQSKSLKAAAHRYRVARGLLEIHGYIISVYVELMNIL